MREDTPTPTCTGLTIRGSGVTSMAPTELLAHFRSEPMDLDVGHSPYWSLGN